jgi:hypothetical protein
VVREEVAVRYARAFVFGLVTWIAIGGVGYGVWSLSRAAWGSLSRTPAVLSGCYVNGHGVSCEELLGENRQ